MYLAWGLVNIEGLTIDGEPATAERLIERGPDESDQGNRTAPSKSSAG